MVVHSGPTVAENCCGQLLRHSPHLPHVLVVNELVQSRDKLGREVTDRKMEKRTPILRWVGEREKVGLHRENPPSSGNFHHLQLPQIKSELFETHVIRSAVMWPTRTIPPCCTCVHSIAALNPFLSHSSPHSFINSISVRRFNFGTCFSTHVPRRGRAGMTKEERMLAGISIATAILT